MSSWKNVQYKDGRWKTASGGGGDASTLDELDDVNLSSPTDGQVLKYNETSEKWENGDASIYPFSIVDGKVCITYEEA